MKEWLLRLSLLAASTLVGLGSAEVLVRVFYPISDGRDNVTLEGAPIKSWFDAGSVYRQVSNEYDARTTITDKGHRIPGTSGNPDVVFLGDSFTFGWGIADADTFVSIYCTRTGRSCANLGVPGTGTAKQLNRLEQFLDTYDWHPKEVKLVFFGMSTAWSAGNDFVDNYDERELVAATAPPATNTPAPPEASGRIRDASPRRTGMGLAERVIGLQTFVLGRSNLMRLAKFYWGPMLKSMIVAEPGQERIAQALHFTERNLKRLDDMSRRRGFAYTIYLIVPVQDLIRRSYPQTLDALSRIAPTPVISTAGLFTDAPARYYYSYDGHINTEGSRRVGAFLVDLEHARATGGLR